MMEINENSFQKEVLESGKVLVDFNATWCGPCRMLHPILDEFNNTKKVKICSVDVDQNENLAKQFAVYSIPCLILFENGKEIKRNVGLISLDELETFVGE